VAIQAGTGRTLEASRSTSLTAPGAAALLALAAVFAVLGLLVLLRGRYRAESGRFALFAMAAATALALGPAAAIGMPLAHVLESLALVWLSVSFVALFAAFPSAYRLGAQHVQIWLLAWVAIGVGVGAFWLLMSTLLPGAYLIARAGVLLYLVSGLTAGLLMLLLNMRRAGSEIAREQLRVVTAGTLIGVVPFVVLSIIPYALRLDVRVPPEWAVLGVVAIPAAFTYGILRHELMGIRRLVHRGMAYLLVSLVVLLGYAGVAYALDLSG
jgi:hypothetical protein